MAAKAAVALRLARVPKYPALHLVTASSRTREKMRMAVTVTAVNSSAHAPNSDALLLHEAASTATPKLTLLQVAPKVVVTSFVTRGALITAKSGTMGATLANAKMVSRQNAQTMCAQLRNVNRNV